MTTTAPLTGAAETTAQRPTTPDGPGIAAAPVPRSPAGRPAVGGTVLVTGATGGMGAAICARLAKAGYRVAMLGRDAGRLARTREELLAASHAAGGPMGLPERLVTGVMDLGDPGDVTRTVEKLAERHGRITAVVHTAGDSVARRVADTRDEEWRTAFEIKLLGAVRLVRAVRPTLAAAGGGSIVLISGFFRLEPSPLFPIASALNAAVGGFAKAVSTDLATDRIRINVVDPGATDTGRWAAYLAELSEVTGAPGDVINQGVVDSIPLGRLASPDDVAAVVAFLVSPEAGYLTGGSYVVDGGAGRTLS